MAPSAEGAGGKKLPHSLSSSTMLSAMPRHFVVLRHGFLRNTKRICSIGSGEVRLFDSAMEIVKESMSLEQIQEVRLGQDSETEVSLKSLSGANITMYCDSSARKMLLSCLFMHLEPIDPRSSPLLSMRRRRRRARDTQFQEHYWLCKWSLVRVSPSPDHSVQSVLPLYQIASLHPLEDDPTCLTIVLVSGIVLEFESSRVKEIATRIRDVCREKLGMSSISLQPITRSDSMAMARGAKVHSSPRFCAEGERFGKTSLHPVSLRVCLEGLAEIDCSRNSGEQEYTASLDSHNYDQVVGLWPWGRIRRIILPSLDKLNVFLIEELSGTCRSFRCTHSRLIIASILHECSMEMPDKWMHLLVFGDQPHRHLVVPDSAAASRTSADVDYEESLVKNLLQQENIDGINTSVQKYIANVAVQCGPPSKDRRLLSWVLKTTKNVLCEEDGQIVLLCRLLGILRVLLSNKVLFEELASMPEADSLIAECLCFGHEAVCCSACLVLMCACTAPKDANSKSEGSNKQHLLTPVVLEALVSGLVSPMQRPLLCSVTLKLLESLLHSRSTTTSPEILQQLGGLLLPLRKDLCRLSRSTCPSLALHATVVLKSLLLLSVEDDLRQLQLECRRDGSFLWFLLVSVQTSRGPSVAQTSAGNSSASAHVLRGHARDVLELLVEGCVPSMSVMSRTFPPMMVAALRSSQAISSEAILRRRSQLSLADGATRKTRLNWERFWQVFSCEADRADLIWNEDIRCELANSLRLEFHSLIHCESKRAVWNDFEWIFEPNVYKSELRVGRYFIRGMLHDSFEYTDLEHPDKVFGQVFLRFLTSTGEELQLCAKVTEKLYRHRTQEALDAHALACCFRFIESQQGSCLASVLSFLSVAMRNAINCRNAIDCCAHSRLLKCALSHFDSAVLSCRPSLEKVSPNSDGKQEEHTDSDDKQRLMSLHVSLQCFSLLKLLASQNAGSQGAAIVTPLPRIRKWMWSGSCLHSIFQVLVRGCELFNCEASNHDVQNQDEFGMLCEEVCSMLLEGLDGCEWRAVEACLECDILEPLLLNCLQPTGDSAVAILHKLNLTALSFHAQNEACKEWIERLGQWLPPFMVSFMGNNSSYAFAAVLRDGCNASDCIWTHSLSAELCKCLLEYFAISTSSVEVVGSGSVASFLPPHPIGNELQQQYLWVQCGAGGGFARKLLSSSEWSQAQSKLHCLPSTAALISKFAFSATQQFLQSDKDSLVVMDYLLAALAGCAVENGSPDLHGTEYADTYAWKQTGQCILQMLGSHPPEEQLEYNFLQHACHLIELLRHFAVSSASFENADELHAEALRTTLSIFDIAISPRCWPGIWDGRQYVASLCSQAKGNLGSDIDGAQLLWPMSKSLLCGSALLKQIVDCDAVSLTEDHAQQLSKYMPRMFSTLSGNCLKPLCNLLGSLPKVYISSMSPDEGLIAVLLYRVLSSDDASSALPFALTLNSIVTNLGIGILSSWLPNVMATKLLDKESIGEFLEMMFHEIVNPTIVWSTSCKEELAQFLIPHVDVACGTQDSCSKAHTPPSKEPQKDAFTMGRSRRFRSSLSENYTSVGGVFLELLVASPQWPVEDGSFLCMSLLDKLEQTIIEQDTAESQDMSSRILLILRSINVVCRNDNGAAAFVERGASGKHLAKLVRLEHQKRASMLRAAALETLALACSEASPCESLVGEGVLTDLMQLLLSHVSVRLEEMNESGGNSTVGDTAGLLSIVRNACCCSSSAVGDLFSRGAVPLLTYFILHSHNLNRNVYLERATAARSALGAMIEDATHGSAAASQLKRLLPADICHIIEGDGRWSGSVQKAKLADPHAQASPAEIVHIECCIHEEMFSETLEWRGLEDAKQTETEIIQQVLDFQILQSFGASNRPEGCVFIRDSFLKNDSWITTAVQRELKGKVCGYWLHRAINSSRFSPPKEDPCLFLACMSRLHHVAVHQVTTASFSPAVVFSQSDSEVSPQWAISLDQLVSFSLSLAESLGILSSTTCRAVFESCDLLMEKIIEAIQYGSDGSIMQWNTSLKHVSALFRLACSSADSATTSLTPPTAAMARAELDIPPHVLSAIRKQVKIFCMTRESGDLLEDIVKFLYVAHLKHPQTQAFMATAAMEGFRKHGNIVLESHVISDSSAKLLAKLISAGAAE